MSSIKNILPVLVLICVSCTKYERKHRPSTDFTGFTVEVVLNEKLATGQIVETYAPVGIMHVWKADNKHYEILSVADAVDGYATEMNSGRLESASYNLRGSQVSQITAGGKYFVFVMLDESPSI